MFGPKRVKVAEGWRRLYSEKFHNLYALQNIIRVTKSRWMKWVGHVARMEETKNAYKMLVENLKRRDYSLDVDVDRRLILEWILGK